MVFLSMPTAWEHFARALARAPSPLARLVLPPTARMGALSIEESTPEKRIGLSACRKKLNVKLKIR
jgi:hypothetical protein